MWLIMACVVLAAVVAVAPLAIRGSIRYYALSKVLRLPQAEARLAVKPVRRTLTNQQEPIHLVNLGYATFDTGSTNQLFVESRASGASIMLTNSDVSMFFLPPFAPEKSTGLASSRISALEALANPNTVARMKEWETNQIAAEMAWEETQPLPPSRILLMNGDDFLLYSLKVAFKAGNRIGSKAVQFFQSPYTKGIVRVGENTNDSRFAAVYFASLDGTKNVGLRVMLANSSDNNIFHYLDPILRYFRFTVETVDDREAVKAMISEAGIQQKKETPTDD